MELKNYSKSFGIRVPMDLYFKMQTIAVQQGTTLTDLSLMAFFNFGLNNPDFSISDFHNKPNKSEVSKEHQQRHDKLLKALLDKGIICDELIEENNKLKKMMNNLKKDYESEKETRLFMTKEFNERNKEITVLKDTINKYKKLYGEK